MLWVPQKGRELVQHNAGTVGTNTPGTSITTGAASGTKGTAVELITSTSFDVYRILIMAWGYAVSATASEGCLDILVGAATEEVLIPNLLMGYCANGSTTYGATGPATKQWEFPLYIPAGTRIAAQAAGDRTSSTLRVIVYLFGADGIPHYRVGSKVVTYGVTVPVGTTIVPGASGAEGAWTQITASTTEDHFAVLPSFQPGSNTTLNNRVYYADVGVGAATEEEIGQSYVYAVANSESMQGPINAWPTIADIPSGTRLSMRVSNSGTNDTGNYNGALHCVS